MCEASSVDRRSIIIRVTMSSLESKTDDFDSEPLVDHEKSGLPVDDDLDQILEDIEGLDGYMVRGTNMLEPVGLTEESSPYESSAALDYDNNQANQALKLYNHGNQQPPLDGLQSSIYPKQKVNGQFMVNGNQVFNHQDLNNNLADDDIITTHRIINPTPTLRQVGDHFRATAAYGTAISCDKSTSLDSSGDLEVERIFQTAPDTNVHTFAPIEPSLLYDQQLQWPSNDNVQRTLPPFELFRNRSLKPIPSFAAPSSLWHGNNSIQHTNSWTPLDAPRDTLLSTFVQRNVNESNTSDIPKSDGQLRLRKQRIESRLGCFSGGSVLYLNHDNRTLPTLQAVPPPNNFSGLKHLDNTDSVLSKTLQMPSKPYAHQYTPSSSMPVISNGPARFSNRKITTEHPYARPSSLKPAVSNTDNRPKTFEFESLEVGQFKLFVASDVRSEWTAKIKVVFGMKRLIYEFPFSETGDYRQAETVRHYAVIVPFEAIAMIRQEGSQVVVTLKCHPIIFDSEKIKEVTKNVNFDASAHLGPLMGQFKKENVHRMQFKEKQTERFISCLLDHDRTLFEKLMRRNGNGSYEQVLPPLPTLKKKYSVPVVADNDKEVVILSLPPSSTTVADELFDNEEEKEFDGSKDIVLTNANQSALYKDSPLKDNGGNVSNGNLEVELAAEPCRCRNSCRSSRCSCFKNNSKCQWTENGKNNCRCVACSNPLNSLELCNIKVSEAMQDICLARHVNLVSVSALDVRFII